VNYSQISALYSVNLEITTVERKRKCIGKAVVVKQWRTEGVWGVKPPPPPSFAKAEPNSQFRGKYIRNNLIRI
jgi:hypothetical protein